MSNGVDDDDDDSIESIVRREQEKWKKQAETAKFHGRTRAELFKEARKIELMIEKRMMSHKWDSVYYYLFLYIEICMKNNLHKADKRDGGGQSDTSHVVDVLKRIEKKVEVAKRGMLFQYKYHRDVEAKELERKFQEEKRRVAASSLAPAAAAAVTAAGEMTLEQMSAAMDALRMPGQQESSIPIAILASKAPPSVASPAVPDLPPPPYNAAVSHKGGMSAECSVPASAVTTLVLKQVLGDGSCAFRSIAQGMHQGRLSPDQEKRKADELRRLVVQLLIQRGQEEMVGTGMTIEQVVLMKDSYSSYSSYCQAMSRSEYAGETEFWLLSEELDIRIAIFMTSEEGDGGLEHMITYGTAKSPPVCLFWQRGRGSEAGNHYDCLLFEDSSS